MNVCLYTEGEVLPLPHQTNPAMKVLCNVADKMEMFLTFLLSVLSFMRGAKQWQWRLFDSEDLCKLYVQILLRKKNSKKNQLLNNRFTCLSILSIIKVWMEMRSRVAWIWITWRRKRNSTCLTLSSWWSHPTAWTPSPHADAREHWIQTTVSRKGLYSSFFSLFTLNINLPDNSKCMLQIRKSLT